jgi:tetratricopeptide (TPR) repeat protein/S1-C subfamily serine protease
MSMVKLLSGRNVLVAIAISAFSVTTTLPWMVHAEPGQPVESASDNAASIQQLATKITVKIQVGEGGGSGVLIGKKGSTYLVLTNAHVLREKAGVKIRTFDGQNHSAKIVKNVQIEKFDWALVEFNSSRNYQLASFRNFETKGDAALNQGREVFAAGFAYDSAALRFLAGEVTQLPQEPFVNGTQVGYVTKGDLKQGMSGGPILDGFGNLVGINTTLSYPVVSSYTYADGSKAPPDKIAEYRQANWSVPIYNFLTRLNPDILYSYKQLPKLHRSVTPTGYTAKLDRQARLVTVRVENDAGNGSGVIISKEGNTYYVLTAEHVLKNTKDLKVTTHDQRAYKFDSTSIKNLPGLDLAIIKFTSNQSYQVAKLGNYPILDNFSLVFSAGWPAPSLINSQQWQWQLNPGTIRGQEQAGFQIQDKQSFTSGYDLIYSSVTYGGMSGGPVFDSLGQVIGIHGRSEGGGLTGNSLGISIRTFLDAVAQSGIDQKNLMITATTPSALDQTSLTSVDLVRNNIPTPNNSSDANQWIAYGNQLRRSRKYDEADRAFDKAISLDPNSLVAHYSKGEALLTIGNYAAALQEIDKAIALVPLSNQNGYYYLWRSRTIALLFLGRYEEGLSSINKAISLESSDAKLLSEKARLLIKLKKYAEAVKVCDQMVALEPKNWAYLNRGAARYYAGNYSGSIKDYNTIIKNNPKHAPAYVGRGNSRYELKDIAGAMADFNLAIELDANNAFPYYNRGRIKSENNDTQGALADYDQAIKIDGDFSIAYVNRGRIKSASGMHTEAIIDYNTAIKIDPFNEIAFLNRGAAQLALKNYVEAIADFSVVIKLSPQNSEAFIYRAIAKQELQNHQGAIEDYDAAINLKPKSFEAHFNRGTSKISLGKYREAITDYDIAIKLRPENVEAYRSRAFAKINVNDYEGALADYNIIIKLDTKSVEDYRNRGTIKFLLKDYKGAIADWDIVIKLQPDSAFTYYNRAIAKLSIPDKKGAIADLTIAAKLYKEQNNEPGYEEATKLLKALSQQ